MEACASGREEVKVGQKRSNTYKKGQKVGIYWTCQNVRLPPSPAFLMKYPEPPPPPPPPRPPRAGGAGGVEQEGPPNFGSLEAWKLKLSFCLKGCLEVWDVGSLEKFGFGVSFVCPGGSLEVWEFVSL